MKNLLKFLSIGLVMVLVMYSQMTPNQTTEAADDTVAKDTVEFMNEDTTGSIEVKKQSYFNADDDGETVAIYINDADLNEKFSGTTTYKPVTDDDTVHICASQSFSLITTDNAVPGESDDDCTDSAAGADNADLVDATLNTGTLYTADSTVIDGTIVVTRTTASATEQFSPDSYNLSTGTFSLGNNTTVVRDDGTAGNVITIAAAYDYHAQNCYAAVDGTDDAKAKINGGCGDGTYTASQRVKIKSTSDSTGEWITILEVTEAGADDPTNAGGADDAINTGIFRGQVNLSTNASSAAADDDSVWVQDGDTLTVEYYEEEDSDGNVGALIDSDEATIDATAPTITSVSPSDGHLTNVTSPSLEFTITDEGSGFDESMASFGDHVAVSINGCDVADSVLSVEDHDETTMTVSYKAAIDWTTLAQNAADADADCADADAASTRTYGGFNVDSTYTGNVNDVNETTSSTLDGIQFSWQIVATDEAGNSKTLGIKEDGAKAAAGAHTNYATSYADSDLNIRIDTQAPAATGVDAATAWDSGTKADDDDNSSVKVTFDESMDKDSITAADFTVTGTGVTSSTIVSVTLGGTGVDTDRYVYLDLAEDLGPNAKPKVKLVGTVTDKAGNELKPATGDTSLTLGTGSDGVDPTISDPVLTATLLAEDGEATISFTSNENLTNTGTAPNRAADGAADGADHANADHVGCTCGSMSGGNTDQVTAANDAGAIDGTDTTKVAVSLTSPKAGSGDVEEGDFSTDGIYGIALTGRDAADNNGVAGITKVTNEDVSVYFTAAGALDASDSADGTAADDGQMDADNDLVEIKLKHWPLADHDGDGELSDSIVGITVEGTALTAAKLLPIRIKSIDWGEDEAVLLIQDDVSASTAIDHGDTVKVTYWYVDAANTIEVDTSAPTAAFDPADGESTTDTTPSIEIKWDDDEYAGDTHKTVTIDEATLTDSDGTITDIAGELSTTDNIAFYYKPTVALATGEYTIKTKATDEAGNESSEQSAKITIKDRTKTEITLTPGWNLVSLPGEPADGAINTLITNPQVDTVLTYDPSTPGGWLTAVRDGDSLVGTLTSIDASHAYWVHTNNSDNWKVDVPGYLGGATALPPVINIVEGWNLVPAVTLTGATSWDADVYFSGLDWVKAKSWSASNEDWTDILPDLSTAPDTSDTNIASGAGYWLYSNEAGVIVP